jgi:hypothetical protein
MRFLYDIAKNASQFNRGTSHAERLSEYISDRLPDYLVLD